jgi:hypothetical protein
MWKDYSQHYSPPRPLTIERYDHFAMIARIDALTDAERRDLCVHLSSLPQMDNAIRFVTR